VQSVLKVENGTIGDWTTGPDVCNHKINVRVGWSHHLLGLLSISM